MNITLTLAGESEPFWTGPLEQFLAENELSPDEIAALRCIRPGIAYTMGGGAAPEYVIRRVLEPPADSPVRDAKALRKSTDALMTSFTWDKTREGCHYWLHVYLNLERMLAEHNVS